MDAIPAFLQTAAERVRIRLDDVARATAAAPARSRGGEGASTMAAFARSAIFADAVDAATHARLEELKTVTK